MLGIFKAIRHTHKNYNPETYGYIFIRTAKNEEDFYDCIKELEQSNFIEHENGIVTRRCGSEAYDPSVPYLFVFKDYDYYLDEINELQPKRYKVDSARVLAIKLSNKNRSTRKPTYLVDL